MSNLHDDDVVSEAGDPDMFRSAAAASAPKRAGITRDAQSASVGWGRGPTVVDRRKHRYDVNAALGRKALSFGATKVDRLDAIEAGDLLHRIHQLFGIHNEVEERIYAFDQALWYEHAVNGASILQVERGVLRVDGMEFDIAAIMKILGADARRFFRAYADEITQTLRNVLRNYDPYDPESAEMWGAIQQVAVARGLKKYPYLIHDSSEACIKISIEERMAVLSSKRITIDAAEDGTETVPQRPRPNGQGVTVV